MVKRKTTQDISREIPRYPDPIIDPLLNQQKYPRNVLDFDPEINTDSDETFFQEGVISETSKAR